MTSEKKNIVFSGCPSSGKTYLLTRLKELPDFKDYKVPPSIGRTLKELGVPINEYGNIITQVGAFSFHLRYAGEKGILHERSLLDALCFTLINDEISEEAKNILFKFTEFNLKTAPIYDKLIYIPPIATYEDDGVRTKDQDYLKKLEQCFNDTSKKLNLDPDLFYKVKSYGRQERLEEILEFINK
jgi:predicted ATPase